MTKKVALSCLGLSLTAGIAIVCIALSIVLFSRDSTTENSIEIRIQNNMGDDMSDFWLGSGPASGRLRDVLLDDGTESFGPIDRDEVTGYRTIENEFRYFGKSNFVIDSKRFFNTINSDQRGDTEFKNIPPIQLGDPLPLGKYTFAYFPGADSDEANLVITMDD